MALTAEDVSKASAKKGSGKGKKEGLPALAAFNVKMPLALRAAYAQECVDREISANALAIWMIEKHLKSTGKIAKDLVIEIPKGGGGKLREKLAATEAQVKDLEAQIAALKAGKR
jgi:hypothetical protein